MHLDDNIARIRRKIDEIDEAILDLVASRMEYARQIGREKVKSKSATYRPEREAEIYARLERLNNTLNRADWNYIKRIFTEIISASRALEKTDRIGYLGPEGTFTHQAASEIFGGSMEYLPHKGIDSIFQALENGAIDYGVIPVENSIEGSVGQSMDLCAESDARIIAEKNLRITQNLLSRSRDLGGIRRIYTHYQPLSQCRGWLASNLPNAEYLETSSTSEAAIRAAKDKTGRSAAIGSLLAAKTYGLKVVKRSIQDRKSNITRFWVIAKGAESGKGLQMPTGPKNKDVKYKTSLVFATVDKPGALHEVLKPFRESGVNMSRIESRPSRQRLWHYLFFIDFDGNAADKKVAGIIGRIRPKTEFLRILGSYPQGL